MAPNASRQIDERSARMALAAAPTRTDVVGLLACIPYELGQTPEPSTLVVAVLDAEGRHVASLTLPLVNALLAGAPDVVADAVRENDGDAVVVVAYHEATLDAVAHCATHLALGLDHRGLEVLGVAQVGLVTDTWRRMTGWADDDEDVPMSGRYSELADHPALAALRAQDKEPGR